MAIDDLDNILIDEKMYSIHLGFEFQCGCQFTHKPSLVSMLIHAIYAGVRTLLILHGYTPSPMYPTFKKVGLGITVSFIFLTPTCESIAGFIYI